MRGGVKIKNRQDTIIWFHHATKGIQVHALDSYLRWSRSCRAGFCCVLLERPGDRLHGSSWRPVGSHAGVGPGGGHGDGRTWCCVSIIFNHLGDWG